MTAALRARHRRRDPKVREALAEIQTMRRIMYHFRKLSRPSRDFVLWLQQRKYWT